MVNVVIIGYGRIAQNHIQAQKPRLNTITTRAYALPIPMKPLR